MTAEEILAIWDKKKVTDDLNKAFQNNSELQLLATLKENSFLFYELFSRKYGIQPVFHEITFGGGLRCDFAWLNDNSDGPEWVLLEIEKPKLDIFKKDGEPTHQFNHALEQVKSWRRYFNENTSEKKRIFGAVARFRFLLVAGDSDIWSIEKAAKWRIDNNKETDIEIRSSNVFYRALKILETQPEELWGFAGNSKTIQPSDLRNYWENYNYMDKWRQFIN
jgi:hypothetical protein